MSKPHLTTTRLFLRRWSDSDRAPFAAMNADPIVMEHFEMVHTREQSDRLIAATEAEFKATGQGLFATEIKATGQFIGFIGLMTADFEAPFTPAVEIGWRLASWHHGKGYATEGATAVLDWAFSDLGLANIVSFTSSLNVASTRVMQKLHMTSDSTEDFDHPRVTPSHLLRPHVLYRISKRQWLDRDIAMVETPQR